jgi:hypothetical protein
MNIPADCVYEWIAGLNQDTIIYRFYPNGSKDPRNLKILDERYDDEIRNHFDKFVYRIPILCHDQEPLDFAAGSLTTENLLSTWYDIDVFIGTLLTNEPARQKILQQLNLIGFVIPSFNDKIILLHSEKNSVDVQKYDNFCVGCYWWSHAMLALDWYRFAEHDVRLYNQPAKFTYDFNIYCRAWQGIREYRLTLLSLIYQIGLTERSKINFSPLDNGIHFSQHQFQNQKFFADESIRSLDNKKIIPSNYSATYDTDDYNQCAIDVVLETLFDDDRLHITEKTLRPIACRKPFILVGTQGSLKYLQQYGFKTFGHYINEDYDMIADPLSRLQAIAKEMHRIACLSLEKKLILFNQCHKIAEENQKYFFSKKFQTKIVTELKQNLFSAISEIQSKHQHGKNFFEILRNTSKEYYELLDQYMIANRRLDADGVMIKYQLYEQLQTKYLLDYNSLPFGSRID